jgi:ankyrin repeat protein
MIATHTGNVIVFKTLLAHGANVNAATTVTKEAALMWAVAEHPELAHPDRERRRSARCVGARNFTPFMLAVRNGDLELVKALLAAGVK